MPLLILTVSDFLPPDVSSVLHFSINYFCIFSANPSSIMHFFNQLCENMWNHFINQQSVLCIPQVSLAPLYVLFLQSVTFQKATQFFMKYSREYRPHKGQICYWPKVGGISPFVSIFHNPHALPVMSHPGVLFISRHSYNCTDFFSWQDVNAFIQCPCSPVGPGVFQIFILHSWVFFQTASGYSDVFLLLCSS